jgi:pimeloyl-ACP methyl ester carboxylesterase
VRARASSGAPAQTAFVAVDGARLRVRVAGTGPALVLVHGWALDLDMWTPQFQGLARHYRVIAFDRRGFGLSTGRPSLEHDSRDLWSLLGTLGVQRCGLVGMSQGARVVLRCAIARPGRILALVLDGPPAEGLVPGEDLPGELPMEQYRQIARTSGLGALRRSLRRHELLQLRTRRPAAGALLRRMVSRYPARDLLTARPAAPRQRGSLAACSMPVLVINGEHDTPLRLEAGALLAGRLPHATRALIPGAGHLANLDRPATYNRVLDGFLAAHLVGQPKRRHHGFHDRSTTCKNAM